MDAERWQRLQELFEAAAALEADERDRFLAEACAGDLELKEQVESLILHDRRAGKSIGEAVAEAARLPSVAAELSPLGRTFGNYRVLRKLGEGGMGEVFLAEQERPVRRKVALKLIKPGMGGRETLARFESERQALALMTHPTIARVFDAGTTAGGRPFFAMEYVDGVPITRYCDEHRLDTRRRLELFAQVCEGVQHAHHKGIIHRDLKPSNVLVQLENGSPLPKIIDFGVAKAVEQRLTEETLFTEMGQLIGTPEYMSPEQASQDGTDIDTRSDVYSLGVLLYELLVGTLPFGRRELRQAGFDEIRRRIREDEPSRPSARLTTLGKAATETALRRRTDPPTLRRLLRGDLDWITLKALEKDRGRRYGSPADLAADLFRHLENLPVSAGPPGAAYRAGKFVRRHRLAVAAALLVSAALLAGTVGTGIGFVRAVRAEAVARREAATAKRVSEFVIELFRVSDPEESAGRGLDAREILDRGARRITAELREQPEVRATMMDTIGRVYQSLGLYDEAGSFLDGALELRRELLGEEHLAFGESQGHLGSLRLATGEYDRSEELLRAALALQRKAGAGAREPMARTLGALAECLRIQGEYEEAEALAREGLQRTREVHGAEHKAVSDGLIGLSAVVRDRGDYEQAEYLAREALGMRRRLLGDEHPAVSYAMQELAFILQERGSFEEAEGLFRQGLELDRRMLGEDHPSVATALYNLATLLHNTGRSVEAESLFRQVLELDRKQLGNDHLYVTLSMNNLAGALLAQGRIEEAEALYRESLAVQQRVVGPVHPEIATSLANLGSLLRQTGDLGQAEQFFRRALEMRREMLGGEHPHVAVSLDHLAGVLRLRGAHDESAQLYRDALAMRRKFLGEHHPKVATTLMGLGGLMRDSGDPDAAEELYREALKINREGLRPGHPGIAHALVGLGGALSDRGRWSEAEPVLREAVEIRRAESGPRHWQTAEAEGLLGRCLAATGRSDEATRLLSGAYETLRERFGDEDSRTIKAKQGLLALR